MPSRTAIFPVEVVRESSSYLNVFTSSSVPLDQGDGGVAPPGRCLSLRVIVDAPPHPLPPAAEALKGRGYRLRRSVDVTICSAKPGYLHFRKYSHIHNVPPSA